VKFVTPTLDKFSSIKVLIYIAHNNCNVVLATIIQVHKMLFRTSQLSYVHLHGHIARASRIKCCLIVFGLTSYCDLHTRKLVLNYPILNTAPKCTTSIHIRSHEPIAMRFSSVYMYEIVWVLDKIQKHYKWYRHI
jgi:hypothetical protein